MDFSDYSLNSSSVAFRRNEQPRRVPCENQSLNGWGPPQLQALSCCDEVSRFYIQYGFLGGFSNMPNILPGDSELFPEFAGDMEYSVQCAPYLDNLKATLCDPHQGVYIRQNETDNKTYFRICRRSCDLVYQQCKYLLPNSNFTIGIQNGTQFCKQSWRKEFFSNNSCDTKPANESFVCEANLKLKVVDDDCLNMITPSTNDIASYRFRKLPIDACEITDTISETSLFVIIAVGVVGALSLAAAVFLYLWIRRRRQVEEMDDEMI
jgi:hypothetical protein